ncbi:hypothetical protein ACIBF1_06930 [Spirillospora sp. NPDC050679]
MGKVCYWKIHGLEFQEYKSSEATFSLNSIALETLEQITRNIPAGANVASTANIKAAVANTVNKLAKKSDSEAKLIGRGYDGDQAAKLAIGYAYPDQSGPQIVMTAFYLKVEKNVTNILGTKFRTQDTRLWYATAEMEQSTAAFTAPQPKRGKSQRDLMRAKLGNPEI